MADSHDPLVGRIKALGTFIATEVLVLVASMILGHSPAGTLTLMTVGALAWFLGVALWSELARGLLLPHLTRAYQSVAIIVITLVVGGNVYGLAGGLLTKQIALSSVGMFGAEQAPKAPTRSELALRKFKEPASISQVFEFTKNIPSVHSLGCPGVSCVTYRVTWDMTATYPTVRLHFSSRMAPRGGIVTAMELREGCWTNSTMGRFIVRSHVEDDRLSSLSVWVGIVDLQVEPWVPITLMTAGCDIKEFTESVRVERGQ
jgi:hypothetical protein